MKFFSRKLFITITLIVIACFFKYFDKLSDLYFTIIILTISIIYMFVNGILKINEIQYNVNGNVISLKNDEKEEEK